MKKIIPLIVAVLFLSGSVITQADGYGKKGEKRSAHIAEKLQLSDQQKIDFDAALQNHRDRIHQYREANRANHEASGGDREARREEHKAAKSVMREQLLAELSGILTTEQMTQYEEIRARKRGRHKERRLKHQERESETEAL